MTGPMLTTADVCTLLGLSKKTVLKLCRARKIRFVQWNARCIRFRQEDVAEFIARHATGFS